MKALAVKHNVACVLLGVSPSKLNHLVADGQIDEVRHKGWVRISMFSILRYLKAPEAAFVELVLQCQDEDRCSEPMSPTGTNDPVASGPVPSKGRLPAASTTKPPRAGRGNGNRPAGQRGQVSPSTTDDSLDQQVKADMRRFDRGVERARRELQDARGS